MGLTLSRRHENPKEMSIILPVDGKYNTLESVDRISSLPDYILGAILSLLPTKSAVATSTLSKRWEFVWRTVHNLDFCLEGPSVKKQDGVEDEKFVGFVNQVLLHNDAGVLNKFRLVWTPNCIQSHATSWIKTAVTRNVHELSVTLNSNYDRFDYRNGPFDMPISVFSCDLLQSLHLHGQICLSAATVFCFPRLESLDLYEVTFQSHEAFETIIRGCPVLNYLHIDMDKDDAKFRFIISSTSLRRLELNLGCFKYVQLEASSLEHLKLGGVLSVHFEQKNLSSLVEADLDINLDDEDFCQASCISMVDAVSALDSAKSLTLSSDVMLALSCAPIKLSIDFKRLVKLKARTVCCRWSSLLDFIQSSNNLEVLTIVQYLMYPRGANEHDHSNWTTPVQVPGCISTSLKKVTFNAYNGYEDERDFIQYMLKHGSVLEEMHVSCHKDSIRNNSKLFKEICKFPRKSLACKVEFFVLTPKLS